MFRSLTISIAMGMVLLTGCKDDRGRVKPPVSNAVTSEPERPVKLRDLFKERLEKDPIETETFVAEVVDAVVTKKPGMAIKVEKYASEELRKEMDELRRDANVSNLEKLKEEVKQLKESESRLKEANKFVNDYTQEIKGELANAQAKVSEFDVLREKFASLQRAYNEIATRVQDQETKGVSVIVVNDWAGTRCFFEIINSSTKKQLSFSIGPSSWMTINLPPGDYDVNFYETKKSQVVYAKQSLKVTPYISAYYKKNPSSTKMDEFNGIITTPP